MLTNRQYTLNKKIKDESFAVENISTYNLFLQISSTRFRFCVTDTNQNRCMVLEDYKFENIYFPEQIIAQLELIFDDHHFLKAGYWNAIQLAYKGSAFSLIPNSLFDKNFLKEYLSINSSPNNHAEEGYYYYSQKSTDAVTIFSAHKKVVQYIAKVYPAKNIQVINHTAPLIEGIMLHELKNQSSNVYIHVEQTHLTILVKEDKQLKFCNTFYYGTAEDFIYYILFVFDQLNLSQTETPITIWGEITKDSLLYTKLSKYILTISFGDKPSSMNFGYWFDDVNDHNFFDLYSMHLCV